MDSIGGVRSCIRGSCAFRSTSEPGAGEPGLQFCLVPAGRTQDVRSSNRVACATIAVAPRSSLQWTGGGRYAAGKGRRGAGGDETGVLSRKKRKLPAAAPVSPLQGPRPNVTKRPPSGRGLTGKGAGQSARRPRCRTPCGSNRMGSLLTRRSARNACHDTAAHAVVRRS